MNVAGAAGHVGGPAHTAPAPARIWVLLASEADRAVVFRRGPSRWTRLYLWETQADTFTPGSWFRGHLYPWMSDLSPDGEHLLYMARNEAPEQVGSARRTFGVEMRSWTALSQPPFVRAMGLWNASDGWSGGGVFDGHRKVTVNHDRPEQQLLRPAGFKVVRASAQGVNPLLTMLKRTGWRVTHEPGCWMGSGEAFKGHLELRLRWPQDQRSVVYRWLGQSPVPELEGATWADLDRRGELLLAHQGRLYRVRQGEVRELIDLNLDQPKRGS